MAHNEKSLQDSFFQFFFIFGVVENRNGQTCSIIRGSLRHEYNYTRVIYIRADFTTFCPYELRTFVKISWCCEPWMITNSPELVRILKLLKSALEEDLWLPRMNHGCMASLKIIKYIEEY